MIIQADELIDAGTPILVVLPLTILTRMELAAVERSLSVVLGMF